MYDADYQTRATMFGRELPRGNDQELLDEALTPAAMSSTRKNWLPAAARVTWHWATG